MLIQQFVLICLTFGYVLAGPVQVRIEQDNNSNFHVGPEARTTFELIEEYHPLSPAFNVNNRPRALSSSLNKGPARRVDSPAQILVDFGTGTTEEGGSQPQEQPIEKQGRYYSDRFNAVNVGPARIVNNNVQQKPKKSYWQEWSRWSICANGQRIRTRHCIEVNNIQCEGEKEQSQNCFQSQSQVLVARDPLVIEKEILGVDQSEPIRRT